MYYYSLKCIIYTPEDIKVSSDLIGQELPSFDLTKVAYLKNYQHPVNEKQTLSKRRPSQPAKHVPPTPIHNIQSHAQHGLEGKIDFRFGPIEITSIAIKKKKPFTTDHSLGYGVLHFYRDKESLSDNDTPDTKLAKDKSLNIVNEKHDTIVCVVAVPSYLSNDDFLNYLGTFTAHIEHYRFIRDQAPNKYMVLLKFKTRQSTLAFYQKYNGRRYNMTNPETSHIVYLKSCEVTNERIEQNTYPYLDITIRREGEKDMYELPLCPVCLERMDEGITGLLNHECHHIQQCDCIHRWGKPACPICLYSHKPQAPAAPLEPVKAYSCFECQSVESLWICLICGNIGCGRYQEAHAYDHYRDTNHLYALDIETQHIWDYVTDGYVHRLIQQPDGGFVELPDTGKQTANENDKIALDYSYMLSSQMDSQRMYYEEKLDHLKQTLATLKLQVSGLQKDVLDAKQKKADLNQEKKDLGTSMIQLKREKDKLDRRIVLTKEKHKKIANEINEEKLLAGSLETNNGLLEKGFDRQEASLEVLAEKVQVLMVRLEPLKQKAERKK